MKINIRQFAQNCHSRFHIREIKEKLSYQIMFIYRNRQNTFRNLNIMRPERAIKNPRPLTAEMGGTLSALWRQRNFNHFTPRLLSNKLLLIFWFPLGNDLCYTSQDLFWAPHRIPPVTCYFLSLIACFVDQIAAQPLPVIALYQQFQQQSVLQIKVWPFIQNKSILHVYILIFSK